MYRKFKPLNIPDGWEQYWSKYPNGYTIMEALINWVSQVDDMVNNQNELTDTVKSFGERIDEFINQFGSELQKEVQDLLTEWQTTGFLEVVISEAIQWQLDDYITTNDQDKATINQHLQQLGKLVTEYGADTSGVSDSTLAFQTAVNNHKFVIIPEGVFKVSSITVPEDVFIIGQGKQSVLNHFGNQPLFILHDGFKGSHLQDFSITGGTYGVFSCEIGRPHCTIDNIYTYDYKGSGIDLITLDNVYGTSAWCQKISNYTYIGYSERDTLNKIFSPSPVKTWGIRMDVHGGNVIIKDFNIQIANTGIESNNCEQLTISDYNISETTDKVMTRNSSSSVGIVINKGLATKISGGYMENYDKAIELKANKNTEISNIFFSGGNGTVTNDVAVLNDNLDTKLTNLNFREKTRTNVKVEANNVGVLMELIDGLYESLSQYHYTDGRRLNGNYDYSTLFNIHTWTEANGSSSSGTVYLGNVSNRIYTTDGLVDGGTAQFVLPGDAKNGVVYTFIKTKPATLIVKPNAGGFIHPNPSTLNGYKELGGALLGSIMLVKSSNGWNVLSQIGTWAERGS